MTAVVCVAGAAQQSGSATTGTVMTKQQAKELFDSVDSIMKFASDESGLPPVVKVKRRLVTRDEVQRYLLKSFNEDESAKRLQRSELVLKKFGLLSADFDLRPFLLSLLTEQIAGYYDDKTKTVNMLNWIPPEEQKPVLAHELTHAIQDQRVGLEKWSDSGVHGIAHNAAEDAAHVRTDELETARQAVSEGQAMVVFVDWTLKPMGKTLKDSPELGESMKEAAASTSSSPVLARAPYLLQRSLMFPYADGLGFEQALLVKGGRTQAFADALAEPPSSSFQVMHPDKYLAHAPVPSMVLPDVHPLLDAEYDPYDVGVMGELDVEMMTTLFGGEQLAKTLPAAWDGGVYYAAQRRNASVADRLTPGSLGVFYASRWKTPVAAEAFAKIYTAELGRKYAHLRERKADEDDEREQVYSTESGDVLLSLNDRMLFIAEGLPVELARRLRDRTAEVQPSGPTRMAAANGGPGLTAGLAVWMDRLGVARAAIDSARGSLR